MLNTQFLMFIYQYFDRSPHLVHPFDINVVNFFGLLSSLNLIYSSKMYINISIEILDQNALEDFSDFYP